VTEKIALQGQLLQAQKMEAVGQLTGGVAHDFNNLLSIILGNLEFLEERVRYDEPLRKFATIAQHAANRGADLTRRLLAFSRRQVLEPVNVDMNAAVSGLAGMITRTLGEHIEVQTVLALGLWETRIDPAQLESTLLNLCVNARDAMPDGGKLTIETANFVLDSGYAMQFPDVKSGDYVLLTVSDRGTGMSREIVERAFEPFFTTKERDKGTGLGLSMVYGFVKQSGGHITISSELGRGTSVKLYFPRADSASTRREPAAAVMSEPKGTETILVVEDEPDVRRTVVGMLRGLGYRVLVAENGPTALKILENAAIDVDLLFTDLIMSGGMNGLELAEKVQVLRPGLHVLYTSGYADGAVRGKENILRDKQLIAKPYVRQVLAERVRQSLDR
jgi:nitrogen-specific signal transduction histidine kinase/CheY-like chemotaxis protein